MDRSLSRPVIFDYPAVPEYLRAMEAWRRRHEPAFSLRRETRGLRRCSASLVTRVLQGKRRLTPERVDDFARLLGLSPEEKGYLLRWVLQQEVEKNGRGDR